jgi:hypothetical protein
MGAKGIVLQNGLYGIWYFDTGSKATTADEQFTPTLISLTDKSTQVRTQGDMDRLTDNGIYNVSEMVNAPTSGWCWVQVINHSSDPINWITQIAHDFNNNNSYRRTKTNGAWSAWELFLTQSNTPAQYYSTQAPSASDGKDGDVWDVYV